MNERDMVLQLVLGELPQADLHTAKALLDKRPDLAVLARQAERTLEMLRHGASAEAAFRVRPPQKQRLYNQAPVARRRITERLEDALDTLIATVSLDTWRQGVASPAVRGGDGSRRVVFESEGVRVDLRIEPSPTRLGGYDCVGRVDGSPIRSLVWHELDRTVEHPSMPDEHGFFEVSINAGRQQLQFIASGRAVATCVIHHPGESA